MARPAHAPSSIPIFDSIQETAEFWDTHDSTEFEDKFEPVDWEIGEVRNRYVLQAEVDRATLRSVRDLARAQGLEAGDLVRRWIEEGLARAAADAPASPHGPSHTA
ncbi:MAG: BrnA antitoxin family protein [Chloroflexota bacterium]|nr:BrnA antitoxin family protein [Chloroflexota bacterium]